MGERNLMDLEKQFCPEGAPKPDRVRSPVVAGFLGTSGGVCFSREGYQGAFARAGLNLGNLMFQSALWDMIRTPKLLLDFGHDPKAVRNDLSCFVIPSANQVYSGWDLSVWAQFVEELDLPVTVVGLGAQARLGESSRLQLQPGTVRYLEAIAERSWKIGVRGVYTQEVLDSLGITNTIVVGCPSNFINPRLSGAPIAAALEKLRALDSPQVVYNLGTLGPEFLDAEKILWKISEAHRARIVYQEHRAIKYLFDRDRQDPALTAQLNAEVRALQRRSSVEECLDLIDERGEFYSDAHSWIDHMRRFDMTFGMRIHGAVAAIQAGIVGICVAFDSRTWELATTMGYPYLLATDLTEGDGLHALLSKVRFDPDDFDTKRALLKDNLEQLLSHSPLEFKLS